MSWYTTGTVTVTNGWTAVNGVGTSFVGAVAAGHGFVGPDGRTYEVAAVTSATQILLASPYLGSTQAGADYGIFPTYAGLVAFNARLNALLTDYEDIASGPGIGKFADGASGAPSISFAADVDTGVRRRSTNLLSIVAGGQDILEVGTAGASLKGLLTGTAVQSGKYDRTAGRLLTVGAFGYGDNLLPNVVLNDAVDAGRYSYTFNDPNAPTGNSGTVEVRRSINAPTGCVQIATSVFSGSESFQRHSGDNGVTWTVWSKIFTHNNILGTVSSSGGLPTGAIIERGSNANGEYVLFADGLVFMSGNTVTLDITTASGNMFITAVQTWTLPFTASIILGGNACPTNSELNWGTLRVGGTSSVTWRGFRPVSATAVQFRPFVIGKVNL